jgi:deoxyribodipyrimidine photo-lyase
MAHGENELQLLLSTFFPCLPGHVSPQRAILEVKRHEKRYPKSYASFINEVLVWREMTENYCFYNKDYDNFSGAPRWAIESLLKHQ